MGMICRPILLHNEYVPAITGKREYEYLVLGHHDGMTIGEAFPLENPGFFEKIFLFNAKYEGRLSQYSTQFFYGFHGDAVAEKAFWESKLPFTFMSFIQFTDEKTTEYQKYLESLQYRNNEKKNLKLTESTENIRTIAYYTLDSSDVIFVIKCGISETGTQIINNLHQDVGSLHPFRVRNSYSILGINFDSVENGEDALLLEDIDRIELRIIERKSGSVNALYNAIEDALKERGASCSVERKGLMGTEDEAIIIHEAKWRDLLPFYKRDTGILVNSNKRSQRYASAITTKVLYPVMTGENNADQEMNDGEIPTPFCDYLYEKIERIYENQCTMSALTEKKNLVMLVNALRKIEYSNRVGKTFNDYCFYTIMMPTAMFVRLREKEKNDAVEFYEFIKYVKLCMQNYVKPDRVYQQITDFNIRYFDIPPKLIALYNAYLYYAKQALNIDTKGEYEFLLCPGMNRKTEVKELFQGTDSHFDVKGNPEEAESHHLFRVEIPESQVYNPGLMFFTLGHEVSHFVGRAIRKREVRYESILRLTSRMTAVSLREKIRYALDLDSACFGEEIWRYIENEICREMEIHIEGYLNREYMKEVEYDEEERIEKQIAFYRIFYRHTSVLKILLDKAVKKTLHFKSNIIFDRLIWEDVNAAVKSGKIVYEERKEYYRKQKIRIEECVDRFLNPRTVNTTDMTLENGIENIMYLLEECYADISCILLLRLSLEDYLGNLVKILETFESSVEDIKDTRIITRVVIVMAVMSYEVNGEQKEKGCFFWQDSEILTSGVAGEEEVLDLQEEALNYMHAYIGNQEEIPIGEMEGDIQSINLDAEMLREIIAYLLKCRSEYYRRIQREDERKVERFCGLAGISNADDFWKEMTSILKAYEQDIYGEIQKLKESEERTYGEYSEL